MAKKNAALQMPADTSGWVPAPPMDLNEDDTGREAPEQEEAGAYAETSKDYDGFTVWKERPSEELLEAERLKEALLAQHHDRYFGAEDPGDDLDDEDAWAGYRQALGEG